MKSSKTPRAARVRRHVRLRKKIMGTPERPRLAVFRSLSHIYAQVIDDRQGHTLAAASDLDKDVASLAKGKKKSEVATLVGKAVAEKAQKKGVSQVVFDRGGYPFHGRVKALAEAAREAGLKF
ncbi:MAG TPA: 50S ribosomal protein L18 [Dehalococcoidia bacterium]|nr:50S ribosomal protein L18 [Dehalococcoidia bacterium]